jgi:ornithine cyclodeaminase
VAGLALRFLSRADVVAAGGADIALAVADVRATLGLLRNGNAVMPAETSVPLGGSEGGGRAYALPARVDGGFAAAGVKWAAHRPPVTDGLPSSMALTLVNDAVDGRPLGVLESGLLTVARTAAVTALALAHLSPAPLRRVALLGAGPQAGGHLAMLAALYPALEEVVLWNRSLPGAEALRADIPDPPWPLRVVPRLGAALEGTQAVLSCTDARQPFLPADAVAPGRLMAQIGHDETPFAAIARADAVVVDLWGPFAATSGKSLFIMHRAGQFPAARVAADLGTVLAGGWCPHPGSAVYFSSFGLNVLDIALAARVLRQAAARGIGTLLPLSADGSCWPWH